VFTSQLFVSGFESVRRHDVGITGIRTESVPDLSGEQEGRAEDVGAGVLRAARWHFSGRLRRTGGFFYDEDDS
jgi:hypothetical protein